MDANRRGSGTVLGQGATAGTIARTGLPSISLVLPAHNAAKTIGPAIAEGCAALARLTDDFEVIVVDDGSTDQTVAIAGQIASSDPAVRVVSQQGQRGYGAALRTGLRAASKAFVGIGDASGAFDAAQFDRLALLARDHDIAVGYSIERQGTWLRRTFQQTYNLLARVLLGVRVRDCTCPLKLMRREVAQRLPLAADDSLVHAELLTHAHLSGLSIVEVGVTERHEPAAQKCESLFAIFAILLSFVALCRLWWNVVRFPATDSASATISRSNWRVTTFNVCLLAALAAPLLWNLSYPLVEPDENRTAQIGLEMFQSGDLVVPTRAGQPYLVKPPLLFWMISSGYALFGVDEASARLPVALAALITVLATYLLGRRLVGDRSAWLGALMLLLSAGFVLTGRFLLMDAVLTMCTTLALLTAFAGATDRPARLTWWLFAGAACGLGILVKGPIALVLVVPPLAAATCLSPAHFKIRWRDWGALIGLALLIAAPWYIAVAARQGDFLGEFFWKQNLVRFTNAFDHRQPWWFYIPVLYVGMLPASVLLPGLGVFLLSGDPSLRRHRTPALGFLVLAAGWVLFFFSLSSSKLPTYVVPALPAICLLLGSFLNHVILPGSGSSAAALRGYLHYLRTSAPGHAVMAIAVLAIAAGIADISFGPDAFGQNLLAGGVIVAAVAFLVIAMLRWFPGAAAGWSCAGTAALAVLAYAFVDVYPEGAWVRSELRQSAAELAEIRRSAPLGGGKVVLFGALSEGMSLYTDDAGLQKFNKDQARNFAAFAKRNPQSLVIATRSHAANIAARLSQTQQLKKLPGREFVYELATVSEAAESVARKPGDRTQ